MLRQYFDILKPALLGWDFIEPYSKKEPNFGPIGLITYLRTYSRFIPELGRREHWWETVLRVVEYSLSLDTVTPLPEKKEEAKVLYDYMYEMKVFPAGRTLFVGGSPSTANLEGTSNFNCFTRSTQVLTINGPKPFSNFQDGQEIQVLTSNTDILDPFATKATVKTFGVDNIYELHIVNVEGHQEVIETTANHRWWVSTEDGVREQTTSMLQPGSILFGMAYWRVVDVVATSREEEVWCLEVPINHNFFLGNSILTRNCSFIQVDSIKAFTDNLYLLMNGCGVGFSVEEKYVKELPPFFDLPIKHKDINPVPKNERQDETTLILNEEESILKIGDSKHGWMVGLQKFLEYKAGMLNTKSLLIDYNWVRPAGERLKKFGGRASGYGPLKDMFNEVNFILYRDRGKLTPVGAMDVMNSIAKAIIVGGSRRSAQIALGDVDDEDFKNAKVDLFSSITEEKASEVYEFLESIGIDGNELYQWAEAKSNDWLKGSGLVDYRFLEQAVSTVKDIKPEYVDAFKALADKLDPKFRYRTTRVLSNNSVMLWEKPSKEELAKIFEPIKVSGEPGFIFAENAAKRRADFRGVNPCGEILLTSEKGAGSTCNLTEVVLSKFVEEDGSFDIQEAKKAIILATRMGSRITNVSLFDEGWDRIQKRDRLLGVSITGVQDAWDAMGIEPDSEMAAGILSELGKEARREANKYHEYMGIPRSLLVTCTKPSGTLSQLPGVSSGGHASYAPYYIRRIRITRKDPIVDALLDLGYTCTPENGQGEDINHPDCNTVVFSFPVKTNAKIRAIDEPAVKQLQRYKTLMDNYIEHNGSITVTVDWPEWDEVIDWVYDNWESCVGVAFLARFDPSLPGNQYPQMPYEVCTEEYYNSNLVVPPSEDELISFIMSHEIQYEEFELEAGCATGACPVR